MSHILKFALTMFFVAPLTKISIDCGIYHLAVARQVKMTGDILPWANLPEYTTHFSFLDLNILPSKNHAWTTGHVVRLIDHNLFITDNIDSELKVLIKWKVYQSKIWMMAFLMTTFQCWLMQKPFMCQSYIQNHIVV